MIDGKQGTAFDRVTSKRPFTEHTMSRIRPIALCLFRHNNGVLVMEGRDDVKNQSFGRPIGGGIEFGETGAAAIVREMKEELNCEVTNLQFVGMIENIFTYNGRPGHEIVLIYDGEFVDRSLYQRASIRGVEGDGHSYQASWRDLDTFTSSFPLCPDGLLEMVRSKSDSRAP
jgi:8-oxo-dGTP pyrophosphatase MutT (NUDIX family)